MSEEESDVQDVELERTTNLTSIASGLGNNSHSDFFFGDGEIEQPGFQEYEPLSNIQNGQVSDMYIFAWYLEWPAMAVTSW